MAISAAAAAWITAISAAVSVASMAMALSARGKGAGDFQDQGLAISRRGQDNPSIVPFGNCIVPAARVWTNVNNNNQKWMVQNFSLGHGPFEAIQQIYIDEQPLFNVEDTDKSEQWFNNVHFKPGFENVQLGVRRGLPTSATWQKIIDDGDGQWTKDHRGDGIGTLSFLIERPDMKGKSDNPYRIMSNNFAVTALVQGVAVIDPRISLEGWNDKSKRVWGSSYNNPACCLLTYLADNEWGFGARQDMVDLTSFVLLANWCDQNKITLDGYVDQGQTFGKILDSFTSTFGGSIFLQNGMITVLPDTISPVMFNVTEEDIVDSINVSNNASEYFNTIKVDFQNSETRYCKDTFVLPADAKEDPTIQADGRIFEDTIDCPMSTNPAYIKMFANRELKRAKLCRKSINLSLTNTQFDLKMGRVFTVTNSLYKLDTKTKWRITKLESSLDKNVLITKVSAEEYNDLVYDTTAYDGIISGNLPRPDFTILPVTNLKFVQNDTLAVGSGTLSWQGQYYGDRRFIVQYKLSAETEWTQLGEYPFESVMVQGLPTGKKIDFRVQTICSIGGSTWTVITDQQVNRTVNLPAVKNLKSDFTGADCIITFDPVSGAISNNSVVGDGITDLSQLVAYYKVDVQHNTGSTKTYTTPNGRFVYSYDENAKNGLERRLNITVTPISIYGDVGGVAKTSAYNSPMDQAGGVKVESELVTFTVSWDNPSSTVPDYRVTNIYIKPTKAEPLNPVAHHVGASSTGSFTRVMDIQSGWVCVENTDYFGSATPPVASAPIYFETKGIDDLLTDSPSFQEVEDNLAEVKKELAEQGGEIVELNDTVALQETAISNNKTLIETTNSKLAQTNYTVQAQGVTITEQTQALSQLDGTVQALKTIKLDTNGKISGLQIGNDGTTSTFDVLADVFRVSHDTSSQSVFEIRDSKTYIKNAMIGDLTASQIRAGSITGNEINSNSIIRAGSGNTSVTMDGSNTTWRLYAGNTNPAAAPFRVNTAGKLFATNCEITGAITATSGSFSGNIDAQSGQVSGYLGVGNSYISGNPQHNFIQGADGRFVVDRAGNMTCQYARITGGEFGGTVKVENLLGDVYRKGYYTQNAIAGRYLQGGSGEQEFMRANIGSQQFAQRITLSNVNAPIRQDETGGRASLYYQVEGQSAIWYQDTGGTPWDWVNFSVQIPAGATWVRFFFIPHNRTYYGRQQAITGGVIETMKYEQVGMSVTTG
jgi:hypothetical protein